MVRLTQRPSSEKRDIGSRGGPPPRARVQRPAGAGGAAQCAGGRRGLIGRVAAAVGGAPFNFRVPMRTGHVRASCTRRRRVPLRRTCQSWPRQLLGAMVYTSKGSILDGEPRGWPESELSGGGVWAASGPPPRDVHAGGSIISLYTLALDRVSLCTPSGDQHR